MPSSQNMIKIKLMNKYLLFLLLIAKIMIVATSMPMPINTMMITIPTFKSELKYICYLWCLENLLNNNLGKMI